MKEIRDIISSYDTAVAAGKRVALATVVHVDGSSYRRPGARMLVTDDGQLTGAISGGCLEGDALRKALLAISQGVNKLVTYDTSDEDDAKFGIQLGCNGVVHILFEPLDPGSDVNPVNLLKELTNNRERAVLVTMFSVAGAQQPGTSLLVQDGRTTGPLDPSIKDLLQDEIVHNLANQVSSLKENLPGVMECFIEYIPAPVSVVIAGAGNDALPLVQLTSMLGWDTTVIDGRATHANRQRFPLVRDVRVVKPGQPGVANPTVATSAPGIDPLHFPKGVVCILMSHNYNYDYALLKVLLQQEPAYIGVLGPKTKLDRMLSQMDDEGFRPTEAQLQKVYGPLGIDIGAETAEEIALSLVAEIKSVLAGVKVQSLRDKPTSIHHRTKTSFTNG
ncbi:MAG: XdhC/CoxI family protein [Chitinophagaceae bacterium]|nr:MAG: XdhC/CoxI family protein [Chitinophagaceae bacterium]